MGYPGSVHDSRVFRSSPLAASLEEKCGNLYILGDSGYPCLANLLTPFKDRGELTRRQRNYNAKLCSNRYIVEHCFGLLKQRFRQLFHIKLRKIPDIVHFIRACCVLHNLALEDDNQLNLLDEIDANEQIEVIYVHEDEELEGDQNGMIRRNQVVNSLPF